MKLRSILRVLSLLAFLSACVAGYLYYSFLKEYAFQEAERNALSRLQTTKKNLSAFFSEKHQTRSGSGGHAPLGGRAEPSLPPIFESSQRGT